MSGWILPVREKDFYLLDQYAETIYKNRKIGGIKYSNYATLHFLNIKQLGHEKIKSCIKFQMKNPSFVHFQDTHIRNSKLIFIISCK